MEHLKVASLGKAPAYLANIILGRKWLPVINILAHYKHWYSMTVKSFITFGPGACTIKHYGIAMCGLIVENSTISKLVCLFVQASVFVQARRS